MSFSWHREVLEGSVLKDSVKNREPDLGLSFMLSRRNLLYMKTTAGSGDLRHVLRGFGGYSGNVLHVVPVPMSFLRHLLWATVRGHCSGLG